MAVKTCFMYAVAVIVFTCVYSVYGQQATPCTSSSVYQYQCNDGIECYSDYHKCDSYNVCADKTDDLNCDSCGYSAFYCLSSRQCVGNSLVCDGNRDCVNGEDEDLPRCFSATPCTSGSVYRYQCNDGIGCYNDYHVCDSYNICADKTDDLNCDSCDGSAFYCRLSRQCVGNSLVCNDRQDCVYGEDEDLPQCTFPPDPSIRMYWTVGQLAGVVIGFVLFLVIVIAIVVVVHKNCKE